MASTHDRPLPAGSIWEGDKAPEAGAVGAETQCSGVVRLHEDLRVVRKAYSKVFQVGGCSPRPAFALTKNGAVSIVNELSTKAFTALDYRLFF